MYYLDSDDAGRGNYFLAYDAAARTLVSVAGPFEDFHSSHFYDGLALQWDALDGKLRLIGKDFASIGDPLDTRWTISPVGLAYQPGSSVVTAFAAEVNGILVVNGFDLVTRKWLLPNPLRTSSFLLRYAEIWDGIAFYPDDSGGAMPVLGVKPIGPTSRKLPRILAATNPHEGFFCAKLSSKISGYFDTECNLVYTFLS